MTAIGKITATERAPSTVDEFYFWTRKDFVLRPFDVVKVRHLKNSFTYGVVEEISHITDSASSLAGFISSDFGDVAAGANTERIGMNYVRARVLGNTENIYTPVLDGSAVSLGSENDVRDALGLSTMKNPLPCGFLKMYDEENRLTIPVHFDAHFLIGPEGAHLNISGISGLAAKTSYAIFLMKAIQDQYLGNPDLFDEGVAFVIFNVKGRDLLAIDEPSTEPRETLENEVFPIYDLLGLRREPFRNVRYFYPFAKNLSESSFVSETHFREQKQADKAQVFKYTFEEDKEKLEMLFANVDDSTGTMESIAQYVTSDGGDFRSITNWQDFKNTLRDYKRRGGNDSKSDDSKDITVLSWRKFSRHFNRVFEKSTIFNDNVDPKKGEIRLEDAIGGIRKNEVFVVDVAKLDEETQGFVFGDVVSAIYDLKLGGDRPEAEIPSKIIVFIDELNKYASKDASKHSPILKRVLEITERGRSLGIVLFGAEQFRSDIHDRVKGNCSTHAYGRTNAIEVAKEDYRYVPSVFKSMMTRLKPGEYILQSPIFRSLLNIEFPKPIYKQFK